MLTIAELLAQLAFKQLYTPALMFLFQSSEEVAASAISLQSSMFLFIHFLPILKNSQF